MGTEIPRGVPGRGRLYHTLYLTRVCLTLHCHSQNDCTKTGSDESRFNISSTVRGKVPRQSKNLITIFEEKGEPKRNQGFKV